MISIFPWGLSKAQPNHRSAGAAKASTFGHIYPNFYMSSLSIVNVQLLQQMGQIPWFLVPSLNSTVGH